MKKYRVNTMELEYFTQGEIITQRADGVYWSNGGYRLDKKLIDAMSEWFEEIEDEWHWLGMFEPKAGERYYGWRRSGLLDIRENNHQSSTDWERAKMDVCETEDEAGFIDKHQEAARELADTLKKLNEGWRPDFESEDVKYTPTYIHTKREIYLFPGQAHQVLEDKFYPKDEEVWRRVTDILGVKKIILALWPEILWRKPAKRISPFS